MTVGERIKSLRISKGIKQTDLAKEIGVTSRVISAWETDSALPSSSNIIPLSKYFNVGVDYILGTDKNENEENTICDGDGNHSNVCLLIGYEGKGLKKRVISKKTYDILEKLLDELK